MKNWLKITALSLPFLGNAIHAVYELPVLATIAGSIIASRARDRYAQKAQESFQPDIDNLNVFHLKRAEKNDTHKTIKPIEISEAQSKGKLKELDGHYVEINNHEHWKLSYGLPKDSKTIMIHHAGYDGYLGSAKIKFAWAPISTIRLIQNNLVPNDATVVCFEGPGNYPTTCTWGGEFDQKCLDFIVKKTVENNTDSSIILTGLCKGGTAISNYFTNTQYHNENLKHIKAVILESIPSSVAPYADRVAKCHVPSGLQWTIPLVFKGFLYPYAPWNASTIIDKADKFPSNIPVHISWLANEQDDQVDPNDTRAIAEALKKQVKEIQTYQETDNSLRHGRLGQSEGYQQSVRTFLDKIVKEKQA